MNRQPTKEVNVAKNLTDAFAFIAAVFAIAAVLIAKKQFVADKEFAKFLDVPETKEALKIGVIFLVSGVFGTVTRRIPTLACPVSFLPFIVVIEAFKLDLLAFDKHPSVYIILGAVHFAGSLIYLCQWFTEKPRQTTKNSIMCYVSGFLGAACMAAILIYKKTRGFTGFAVYVEPVFKLLTVFSTLFGLLGILWFVLSDKKHMHTLWCSAAAAVLPPMIVVIKMFFL